MAQPPSFQSKFDERLIELVRQHSVIWDPARKSCRDRVMRDNAWKEIAAQVYRSDKDCRIRWRTIRDSYKKVKKIASESRSKYRRMDNLRFLDCFTDARRSVKSRCEVPAVNIKTEHDISDTIEEGELPRDEEDEDYNDEVLENISDTSVQNDCGTIDARDPFDDDNTRTENAVDEANLNTASSGKEASQLKSTVVSREERVDVPRDLSREIENHVYSFFRSMAQSVCNFPEHLIIETKLKVCQLISEMEMKALMERTSYGQTS